MTILSILLLSSCNKVKQENASVKDQEDDKITITPVEPDNGIGDGAMSIANLHIQNIEKAHKKSDFFAHKAISFDINISFGGKERLDAKMTMLTNSTKIRIDKKDGSSLIYNGEKVFLSPPEANDKGARFDMFTWSYFFALPYKLNDPGTSLELQEMRVLDTIQHQTAKLTFEKNVGDSPDDWYILYTDPKENILKAAAYIVTFGSTGNTEKAESDPHIIQYNDFVDLEGIPFATTWDFYGWTAEKGVTDTLGKTTISNITFLQDEGTVFHPPSSSKEINL